MASVLSSRFESPDPEKAALQKFVRDYDLLNESVDDLETLVVLNFDRETPIETISWLYDRLTASAYTGGAELLVSARVDESSQVQFHVTAKTLRLLEVAESTLMKRHDVSGKARPFSIADAPTFLNEGDSPRKLFTTAEKQRFATIAMDEMRVTPVDVEKGMTEFPGTSIPVSEGTPIVQSLRSQGVIRQLFYLHNPERTKALFHACFRSVWFWPDGDVRNYFGESLALYFSFFHFYLKGLFFPALIGPVLFYLFGAVGITRGYAVVTACIMNLLWITVFFEMWKRKNASLTYSWGTFGMHSYHEPLRPGYYGEMKQTKSGRFELYYPRWKTLCKEYLVSYPIMGNLAIAYLLLIGVQTYCDSVVLGWYAEDPSMMNNVLTFVPSAVYGVVIYLLSGPTRSLAAFLTSWENHATQNAWDMHLMMKLAAVEFVNLFASLFYIGFYLQNWDSLKMQLATLLLVHAFLENISEHVIPYLSQKKSVQKSVQKMQASMAKFVKDKTGFKLLDSSDNGPISTEHLPAKIPRIDPDRWEVGQADIDANKVPYESKYDDYLEIWAQFGYAFMFSAVLPWTGLFCIVANCFEIVADLFKLCFVAQRPMAQRAKNIGAWKDAFVGLGVAAVSTNCALMALSPEVQSLTSMSNQVAAWPYIFIMLEHGVFMFRNILAMVIPDVPGDVRKALAELEVSGTEKRLMKLRQCLKELRAEDTPSTVQKGSVDDDAERLQIDGMKKRNVGSNKRSFD